MVSVWIDNSLGREVAIKALDPMGIGGSLPDEAALLATIKSKHVVELLDICKDTKTGEDYLVMEYISGSDLTNYKPTSTSDLYLNLYQIATGLRDIHSSGCIHRDIKPGNIKHDNNSIVKIIDLGISAAATPYVTKYGRGTNGFCGPEYSLNPIQLRSGTDIFAFGSTAYRFCFGMLDANLKTSPPSSPASFSTARIGAHNQVLASEIVRNLDQCFTQIPEDRPSAEILKNLFSKHLLHGKHVGHFVHQGQSYFLNQSNTSFKISAPKGSFFIVYDQINFIIRQPMGEVFINRVPAFDGMFLPQSCVITIGAGSGLGRTFIPFNSSHPEVIL